jgi:hypothetical protein
VVHVYSLSLFRARRAQENRENPKGIGDEADEWNGWKRFADAVCARSRPPIRLAKKRTIAYIGATIHGPEGVLDMRLWIAMTLAAVGLAVGTWWLTRSPKPAAEGFVFSKSSRPEVRPGKQPEVHSSPIALTSAVKKRLFGDGHEGVEPIAVYVETESSVESAPAPLPPVVTATATSDRLVPRPEAGIESVPFMPYAEEDTELARLRRESGERLARQTVEPPLLRQIRELQETAEPPLNMPNPMPASRPNGKLPCSVK